MTQSSTAMALLIWSESGMLWRARTIHEEFHKHWARCRVTSTNRLADWCGTNSARGRRALPSGENKLNHKLSEREIIFNGGQRSELDKIPIRRRCVVAVFTKGRTGEGFAGHQPFNQQPTTCSGRLRRPQKF